MIIKAAQFAMRAHDGQFRRYTGAKYFFHVARVGGLVAALPFATEELVAGGYLHDTVEDCPFIKLHHIEQEFGPVVAGYVNALTNPSKGRRDLNRADRKALDREHLTKQCYEIRCVKAIDRIDNLRELEGAETDFLLLYAKESIALADALDSGYSPQPLQSLVCDLRNAAEYIDHIGSTR